MSNIKHTPYHNQVNNGCEKLEIKYQEKSDTFSVKHKSDTTVNEVLQLARMRNASQSQNRIQNRADIYRIAFDEPMIDDIEDDGDGQSDNLISTEKEVIDEDLDSSYDLFGKIIDDESIDLLESNHSQLSPNNHHIYVNQLSLADEVAIAESNQNSFSDSVNAISIIDQSLGLNRNNNNKSEGVSPLNVENDDNDCDLGQTYQHLSCSKSKSYDFNENSSSPSNCNNSSEFIYKSNGGKRANSASFDRLINDSKRVMHNVMPENTIPSLRDCVCCSIM